MSMRPGPSASYVAKERETVPLLEPGDRLTRAEFERRYEAMPELRKAELIEGVVYMPSPVRYRCHGMFARQADRLVDPVRARHARRGNS